MFWIGSIWRGLHVYIKGFFMYEETIKIMVLGAWNLIRRDWIQCHFTVYDVPELGRWQPDASLNTVPIPTYASSHGAFHYLYRDGIMILFKIMLYGIAWVQWIKYPDKMFLTAKEWSSPTVTEKYSKSCYNRRHDTIQSYYSISTQMAS